MVVTNEKHRDICEKKWNIPSGTIPAKIGLHAVAQDRALKDGKLNVYWTMCTNNMQAGPNINEERMPGWRDPRNFIIVSDPYPTVSALAADLILPTAMWVEKRVLTVTPNAVLSSGVSRYRHRAKRNRISGS